MRNRVSGTTVGRALLGVWLGHLSLSLLRSGSSRLLVFLGLVELAAALLFIPRRTCRWGGALLLLALAFAAGFHLRAGESAAALWGYGGGVLALLLATPAGSAGGSTGIAAASGCRLSREDRAFLRAFEATRIAPAEFHHREHIRAAWAALCHYPLDEALRRYRAALQRLAARAGKPGIFHETITWAYLLLIHERLVSYRPPGSAGDSLQFADFAARHPDLLTWRPSILDAYYSKEVLGSERARQVFILPRAPAAASAVR